MIVSISGAILHAGLVACWIGSMTVGNEVGQRLIPCLAHFDLVMKIFLPSPPLPKFKKSTCQLVSKKKEQCVKDN